ncbi:MAG: Dabb family protein [bacterium]|nr:Dabb family protein [bacterium]
MEQNKLWHVVLISFKPGASEIFKQEIYDRYQTLDKDCGGEKAGIIFWKVDWNLDLRKNVDLVEIAAFENNNALQAFRTHPKHKELTDILKNAADWQVGDIYFQLSRKL